MFSASVMNTASSSGGEREQKMALVVGDLPSGPLDVYRQKASFNWKELLLFIEGEEALVFKVRKNFFTFSCREHVWLVSMATCLFDFSRPEEKNNTFSLCIFHSTAAHLPRVGERSAFRPSARRRSFCGEDERADLPQVPATQFEHQRSSDVISCDVWVMQTELRSLPHSKGPW